MVYLVVGTVLGIFAYVTKCYCWQIISNATINVLGSIPGIQKLTGFLSNNLFGMVVRDFLVLFPVVRLLDFGFDPLLTLIACFVYVACFVGHAWYIYTNRVIQNSGSRGTVVC